MTTAAPTLPPGPRAPALVQAFRLGAAPYGFLEDCQRAYGDLFTIHLPGDPSRVVACHPDAVRDIFDLPADAYRSDTQSIHLDIGEGSVLFQDGPRHLAQRRILTPPLHGPALRSYARTMLEATDRMIDGWRPGEVRTLYDDLQQLTMDVFLRSVFGVVDAQRGRALGQDLLHWAEGHFRPAMVALSLARSAVRLRRSLSSMTLHVRRGTARRLERLKPGFGLAREKAGLLDRIAAEVAACRAQADPARSDVLALLVRATYEDGSPMEDDDILDQLVTLLVGGHETTSHTLGWAVHHLLSNPDSARRLREEVATFAADGFDPSRHAALTWTDACIQESMRLRPIAPAVGRHLVRDAVIGGWTVPAGTIVWPCIYLVQRHPDVWTDPLRWQPERWLDGKRTPSTHYFPWGGGGRKCLGMAFAMSELRIVLARLVQRTDLALADGPEASQPVFRGVSIGASDRVRVRVNGVVAG